MNEQTFLFLVSTVDAKYVIEATSFASAEKHFIATSNITESMRYNKTEILSIDRISDTKQNKVYKLK